MKMIEAVEIERKIKNGERVTLEELREYIQFGRKFYKKMFGDDVMGTLVNMFDQSMELFKKD